MKVSLIIAYYKNTAALDLIFRALQTQSFSNFEVIIAEDDRDVASAQFIKAAIPEYVFPIKHVRQTMDAGFRKTMILNKAVKESLGEFLVFIDGDCIPHKNFLKAYVRSAAKGIAFFGRRVMVSESLTQTLYEHKNLSALSKLSLWRSGSQKLKYAFVLPFMQSFRETGIWGCNWGIYKIHLEAINGFDEDYQTAGVGEDLDIEWRLKANDIRLKSLRHSAIIYHLFHASNYSETDVNIGLEQLRKKVAAGAVRCVNGLSRPIAEQ